MTDTAELRKIIDESGYKYTHIAKQLGLSRYGLLKKINNETEFLPSEITKLCKVLKIEKKSDKLRLFFAENVDKSSTK